MIAVGEIALVVSLAALFYTFAGYPLLLLVWSKLSIRSNSSDSNAAPLPAVVVVVVVYNGTALISKKIETCFGQDYPADKLRILFVSDGSDDDTCAVIKALGDSRITLFAMPIRRGKAACLNDAVASVTEEFVVFNDVRQEMHPAAIRQLVKNFSDPEVGAVSGELVFKRDAITDFGESMDAYWRYEKFLRVCESQIDSSIGVTGAIYALRRALFQKIPTDTILDDVLIPMNVVMQGKRVLFEKTAVAYDSPSRDVAHERVRKVRTLAGNFQLLFRNGAFLIPWRNRIALQFFSHKVLRLLAPVSLLAALFSNVLLVIQPPRAAFQEVLVTLLALQLFGYGLALLATAVPRAGKFLIVRLAMAFLSLNCFVVLGLIEYISNREAHLWKAGARADSSPETPHSNT